MKGIVSKRCGQVLVQNRLLLVVNKLAVNDDELKMSVSQRYFSNILPSKGKKSGCRKPMYIGHDEKRTANEIYILDSN